MRLCSLIRTRREKSRAGFLCLFLEIVTVGKVKDLVCGILESLSFSRN